MHYLIVIEKTDTGFSAYVPDLSGCITVGNNKEEVETNIQEAIVFHLEGMKEDGMEIPEPSTEALNMFIPKFAKKHTIRKANG